MTNASPKQIDFATRLFHECNDALPAALEVDPNVAQFASNLLTPHQATLAQVMSEHQAGGYEIRQAIDALLSVSKVVKGLAASKLTPGIVNASRIISNKFAKACCVCQANVEAGQGYAAQVASGWQTFCADCAKTPVDQHVKVAADRKPAAKDPEVGVYVDPDTGVLVRVYVGQQSGRLNGKRNDGKGWEWTGRRDFAICTDENRITAEQAAAYGHDNDECVFCGKHLDDPRSNNVGYGPTCAKNNGLPWGVK